MNELLAGLIGLLLMTNQMAAASNLVKKATGASVNVAAADDPVEKEYRKLLERDDAAQADVDKMIRDEQAFAKQDAAIPQATIKLRIEQRLKPVRDAYEDFLLRHPAHARARVAYGSFLNDTVGEVEARDQWEKALTYDTNNPAIYNNLANIYGHLGPVKKAFDYYTRAVALNPKESVYLHNFATTVFLFRKDAMEHYGWNEQQVFNRAFELYHQALALDPDNFILASDIAQGYYAVKPPRPDDAIKAWQLALKLASDDIEREGVYLHIARHLHIGARFDESRAMLNQVTNTMYLTTRTNILRTIEKKQAAAATNAPPVPPAKAKLP
ncbi:MAG: hypothetical protein HZA89_14775 [Verrucomicrobia bacterium]|nr:hypothetical protein [Verrucomicrobiota bacterium]